MRVAVIGSRNFPDLEWVADYVLALPPDTVVVSGGALGVDLTAAFTARRRGLSVKVYRPDYRRYGRVAPLVRNTAIVKDADRIAAFWDGKSRGTMDAVEKAEAMGKPVEMYQP